MSANVKCINVENATYGLLGSINISGDKTFGDLRTEVMQLLKPKLLEDRNLRFLKLENDSRLRNFRREYATFFYTGDDGQARWAGSNQCLRDYEIWDIANPTVTVSIMFDMVHAKL